MDCFTYVICRFLLNLDILVRAKLCKGDFTHIHTFFSLTTYSSLLYFHFISFSVLQTLISLPIHINVPVQQPKVLFRIHSPFKLTQVGVGEWVYPLDLPQIYIMVWPSICWECYKIIYIDLMLRSNLRWAIDREFAQKWCESHDPLGFVEEIYKLLLAGDLGDRNGAIKVLEMNDRALVSM